MNEHDAKLWEESTKLYEAGKAREALRILRELRDRHLRHRAIETAIERCKAAIDLEETPPDSSPRGNGRRVIVGAACALSLVGLFMGIFWIYRGASTSVVTAPAVLPTPTPAPPSASPVPHLSFDRPAKFIQDKYAQYTVPELLERFRKHGERDSAFTELAMRVKPEHAPHIAKLIFDYMPTYEGFQAITLLRIAGPENYDAILASPLQKNRSIDVRRAAATALGKAATPEATMELIRALEEDPDPEVRRTVAHALAETMLPAAMPALQRAMQQDTDKDVRDICGFLLNERSLFSIDPKVLPGKEQCCSWRGFQYRLYLPRSYTGARPMPLLVSVHGTSGRAKPYLDMWRSTADKVGVAILAPWFDSGRFPNYDLPADPPDLIQSDQFLLDAVAQVGRNLNIETDKFCLFGHSQGGQFVCRFVYLHPDRIKKAVISGAGTFLNINETDLFPRGLRPHPWRNDIAEWDFAHVLNMDLLVVCGTDELPRRYYAAKSFMDDSSEYAAYHGLKSRIQFTVANDVPHAGAQSRPFAAEFFFQQ